MNWKVLGTFALTKPKDSAYSKLSKGVYFITLKLYISYYLFYSNIEYNLKWHLNKYAVFLTILNYIKGNIAKLSLQANCYQIREISSLNLSNGPRQANLVLIAYASSEGSGEPAHPRSLARTSATRSYKQWIKRNLQTESQIPGPSEWLGMRS